MALPFQNPVSQCMPGFGSPSNYGAATQTPTTTAALTLTIGATATTPSTGGTPFNLDGGPAPTCGKWHLRMVNATNTTTLAVEITITDGTNTWVVATIPASVATGYLDYTGEFKTDVQITAVAAVLTPGGTSTSIPLDFEVSMNP
jgi:hypothetical protein